MVAGGTWASAVTDVFLHIQIIITSYHVRNSYENFSPAYSGTPGMFIHIGLCLIQLFPRGEHISR